MQQENFERIVELADALRHYKHLNQVLRGYSVVLSSSKVDPVQLTAEDQKMFQRVVLEKAAERYADQLRPYALHTFRDRHLAESHL